ncbi:phosphopantetheine-binding protein [Streptomyces cinnamoneus]|uniref:Phosphopantetheine-binding protein n=1 Tax=Streptomyces cinnamoneus TaxID=53446 RepID=A0A2G1XIV6_STRCJ|nr:phosphopantetheine-binding protein [Streptomyces cinnamoneus]PHQ51155.1 phosphopantetheine-binding protein [Streptomyces cinnamoneus]PPT13622.1 acyl carrier protein [Streptomyces cinnamoneus]
MITEQIHGIWSRELKLDDFSDDDDFFELGGHSLIMTRIQQALSDELGVDVPMDELFRKATVSAISAHVASLQKVA